MNIDLTPIIQATIALLASVVTYKLIPYIKSRTTAQQQAMMRAAVKTLVFAAEQIYGAGNGAEKLDFVVDRLQAQGFTADRLEIEAAVAEHLNNLKVKNPMDSTESQQDGE